jgi:hypothetical protein
MSGKGSNSSSKQQHWKEVLISLYLVDIGTRNLNPNSKISRSVCRTVGFNWYRVSFIFINFHCEASKWMKLMFQLWKVINFIKLFFEISSSLVCQILLVGKFFSTFFVIQARSQAIDVFCLSATKHRNTTTMKKRSKKKWKKVTRKTWNEKLWRRGRQKLALR